MEEDKYFSDDSYEDAQEALEEDYNLSDDCQEYAQEDEEQGNDDCQVYAQEDEEQGNDDCQVYAQEDEEQGNDDCQEYAQEDEEQGNDYAGSMNVFAKHGESDPTDDEKFTALTLEDIRSKQVLVVQRMAAALLTTEDKAVLILRRYNWDPNALDKWCLDEQRTREETGLVVGSELKETSEPISCGICGDEFTWSYMRTALCGVHPFCLDCWQQYIETAIRGGPGSLSLRCPFPKCKAAVTDSMALSLVDNKESAERYEKFALCSFVEHPGSLIKWCPAPDCTFAIEGFDIGSDPEIVVCNCGYSFCWNCKEKPHRPVDCKTAIKWKQQNGSENTTWLLAYTKPCPKCKRPVEKNQGCMHMTCPSPCGFQFCWFCLHRFESHGTHTCKLDVEEKKKAILSKREAIRENERYQHCYERWHANSTSWDLAVKNLKDVETKLIPALSKKANITQMHLTILAEGWKEVVRCRELYTWSFVYDFYLKDLGSRREYLEHHRTEASSALENLHKLLESEIGLDPESENFEDKNWMSFKSQLLGLKKTVSQYFDNLTILLEGGMAEIPDVVPRKSEKELKEEQAREEQRRVTRRFVYNSMAEDADEDAFLNVIPGEHESEVNDTNRRWTCGRCTFINQPNVEECEMCGFPRFRLDEPVGEHENEDWDEDTDGLD